MSRDTANGGALAGPRLWLVVAAVLALGIAPFVENLGIGFFRDDYLHMAELSGEGPLPKHGKLSLFTFAEPVPNRMGPVQGDYWPWWQSERSSIDFFRPLTSATYALQYAVHGADAKAFMVGNLVLWGVVLCVALAFFREVAAAGGRGGVLTVLFAGVFFAMDRTHEENVGWLSGRYTLVGLAMCLPALIAYHRWRSGGGRVHAVWMLVGLLLALLSSELSVSLSGWFLAYELSLGRGGIASRARALALPAVTIGAYVVLYGLTGHGVVATAWYLDPIREPARFVTEGLGERWPRLLANLLASEWVIYSARVLAGGKALGLLRYLPHAVAAVVFLVLVACSVRDRATRFCVLGTLLGLAPLASSQMPPRPRVLLLASVGTSYAFGALVGRAATLARRRFGQSEGPRPGYAHVAATVVAAAGITYLHTAYETSFLRTALGVRRAAAAAEVRFSLEAEMPPDDEAPDARVLMINSPVDSLLNGATPMYVPAIREAHGHPWPGGIWTISVCPEPHVVTRTGPRTVEIELVGEGRGTGFLEPQVVGAVREDVDPVPGEVFRRGALEVTALDVEDDGRLTRVSASLDRDLDRDDVWLLAWSSDEERWRRVEPPAVGESITLSRVLPLRR